MWLPSVSISLSFNLNENNKSRIKCKLTKDNSPNKLLYTKAFPFTLLLRATNKVESLNWKKLSPFSYMEKGQFVPEEANNANVRQCSTFPSKLYDLLLLVPILD